MKKSKKKTKKKLAIAGRKTLSVHELVSELAKALASPLASDERKRITLTVRHSKQRKAKKNARHGRSR